MSSDSVLHQAEVAAPSEVCFLCRRGFDGQLARTREHVVPKWAMRLALLDRAVTGLPNDTSIPYSKRTVPCCADCNSWLERTLEGPLSDAVRTDEELDRAVAYLWMAKIYLGARTLETLLAMDRQQPAEGPMREPHELGQLEWMRLALLAGPDAFREVTSSGSLILLRAGLTSDAAFWWDMFIPSDMGCHVAGVRVGRYVLIASFGDSGWLEDCFDDVVGHHLSEAVLHPLQVSDAFAAAAAIVSTSEIWTKAICRPVGEELLAGRFEARFASSTVIVPPIEDDALAAHRLHSLMTILSRGYGIHAEPSDEDPDGLIAINGWPLDAVLSDEVACFYSRCPRFLVRLGILADAACPACGGSATF